MAQRVDPRDAYDFFPTPPWATRALCEWIRGDSGSLKSNSCWEPACGRGDMADPLREYFGKVTASDVQDLGYGENEDFLFPGLNPDPPFDWIITNPPFNRFRDFVLTALNLATVGVAMFGRTTITEGGGRYRTLYQPHPPAAVLQFCERVPLFKGRLDPISSSATGYCWVVWLKAEGNGLTAHHWIPPGSRKRLERDGDYVRYGWPARLEKKRRHRDPAEPR